MIKAFFVDFYGTLVHEDGEVIRKITDIICQTGKVENRKDVRKVNLICNWSKMCNATYSCHIVGGLLPVVLLHL